MQGGAAPCTQVFLIERANARIHIIAVAGIPGHLEIVHHDDRTPPITDDKRQFLPQRQVREPMRVQVKKHALKRTTRILKQLSQEATTVPKEQMHTAGISKTRLQMRTQLGVQLHRKHPPMPQNEPLGSIPAKSPRLHTRTDTNTIQDSLHDSFALALPVKAMTLWRTVYREGMIHVGHRIW